MQCITLTFECIQWYFSNPRVQRQRNKVQDIISLAGFNAIQPRCTDDPADHFYVGSPGKAGTFGRVASWMDFRDHGSGLGGVTLVAHGYKYTDLSRTYHRSQQQRLFSSPHQIHLWWVQWPCELIPLKSLRFVSWLLCVKQVHLWCFSDILQ
jgi:hypothetical protein